MEVGGEGEAENGNEEVNGAVDVGFADQGAKGGGDAVAHEEVGFCDCVEAVVAGDVGEVGGAEGGADAPVSDADAVDLGEPGGVLVEGEIEVEDVGDGV